VRERRLPPNLLRHHGADLSIGPEDVDEHVAGAAQAVLVGGTYLSRPGLAAALARVVALARQSGALVVLDVDHRPALWGAVVSGGASLDAQPCPVATPVLQPLLPGCDPVVGTEAEQRLACGADDLGVALARIRTRTLAVFVVKRGAPGSVAREGPISLPVRDHELAALVEAAAPVHLELGLRNVQGTYPSGGHLDHAVLAGARERVRRAAIGLELLARQLGDRSEGVVPARTGRGGVIAGTGGTEQALGRP